MFWKFFNKTYSTTSKNKLEQLYSNVLVDKFGRRHTYLRISLTEKCNLRCIIYLKKGFF